MKLKVGDGATQHCVCPKFIMLTIFRGPSGEGGLANVKGGGWVSHKIIFLVNKKKNVEEMG